MTVLGTNPYADGRVPMTLAAIAYAQANDISTILASATQNEWQLVWGPGEKLGNQMYVAHNTATNFYAIAVRGTVVEFDLAFFENWYDASMPDPSHLEGCLAPVETIGNGWNGGAV